MGGVKAMRKQFRPRFKQGKKGRINIITGGFSHQKFQL